MTPQHEEMSNCSPRGWNCYKKRMQLMMPEMTVL